MLNHIFKRSGIVAEKPDEKATDDFNDEVLESIKMPKINIIPLP